MKSWDEIQAALAAPFPRDAIEWRMAQAGETQGGKPWAKCLAYLTNRAIMERLDDVCGCGNWWNAYKPGPAGGVLCGITIYCPDPDKSSTSKWDEGITKWDGAENSEIESVKGGLSDSMKRAAVQWGIGRYLYKLDEGWALCSPQKESGPEWRYQPAKNGKHASFYWAPPELPQWALPESEKAVVRRKKPERPDAGTEQPVAEITDNPYGIPADAWLKLDACRSFDELYACCASLREHSRGANPWNLNWNVGLNTFWKERSAFLKDLEREVFGDEQHR